MSVGKDVLEPLFQINLSLPSRLIPQTGSYGHGDKTLRETSYRTRSSHNMMFLPFSLIYHLESSMLTVPVCYDGDLVTIVCP